MTSNPNDENLSLAQAKIQHLRLSPIKGNFDVAHLIEINRKNNPVMNVKNSQNNISKFKNEDIPEFLKKTDTSLAENIRLLNEDALIETQKNEENLALLDKLTLAEAIELGYDPDGENFSQEEIEEAVKNKDFKLLAWGALQKAILAVRHKLNVSQTLSPKDRFKLSLTLEAFKKAQEKTETDTQNEQTFYEWRNFFDTAKEDYDDLWTKINALSETLFQQESSRRRKAVEGARVSMALEGYQPSPSQIKLSEQFIAGDISLKEYVEAP